MKALKKSEQFELPPDMMAPKKAWRRLIMPAIFLMAGLAIYSLGRYTALQPHKPAEETAAVIAAVGKLMVLPIDEQPTLATVSDPLLLKNQPFFANAKEGDKVLIYSVAQKAILYSPAENKIVEVAPLNLKSAQPTNAQSTTKTAPSTTKKK